VCCFGTIKAFLLLIFELLPPRVTVRKMQLGRWLACLHCESLLHCHTTSGSVSSVHAFPPASPPPSIPQRPQQARQPVAWAAVAVPPARPQPRRPLLLAGESQISQ
jgi:hypothetical protein